MKRAENVMDSTTYRVCCYCVMDSSDEEIVFSPTGRCSYCVKAEAFLRWLFPVSARRKKECERKMGRMKRDGKGGAYDCVIGLSGGVDSSYVAHLVKEVYGMRPLAVHLDNGWNSDVAVSNIGNLVDRLGLDLYTEVLDWDEFRDLQLSFLKGSLPDADVPTDHAIMAVLYRLMKQFKIRHVITGFNPATESILPRSWSYGHLDWRYISGVHARYGTRPLRTFPHLTFRETLLFSGVSSPFFPILAYESFDDEEVRALLADRYAWRSYGDKHHESVYTKFYQSVYLVSKFGIDKRRAHLSSLICGGRVTREQALEALARPAFSEKEAVDGCEYLAKKFDISVGEMSEILKRPPRTYREFPNTERLRKCVVFLQGLHRRLFWSGVTPVWRLLRPFVTGRGRCSERNGHLGNSGS